MKNHEEFLTIVPTVSLLMLSQPYSAPFARTHQSNLPTKGDMVLLDLKIPEVASGSLPENVRFYLPLFFALSTGKEPLDLSLNHAQASR